MFLDVGEFDDFVEPVRLYGNACFVDVGAGVRLRDRLSVERDLHGLRAPRRSHHQIDPPGPEMKLQATFADGRGAPFADLPFATEAQVRQRRRFGGRGPKSCTPSVSVPEE